MIYLSGCMVAFRHPMLGFLLTPDRGDKVPADTVVAADNGCFANPAAYSDDRYMAHLRRFPLDRTLFATAPDVVGDHAATVARSIPMLRAIRAMGLLSAFCAQDGWDEATTPWGEFDVLFVGGTTGFKFRGGRAAVEAANRRGKAAHMGRANSLQRVRAARAIGCGTADGNFLRFAPDGNIPRLVKWFDSLEQQQDMAI